MNDNLIKIFDEYIEKFEYINNSENHEYYKWELAQAFQSLDLDSKTDNFVAQLKSLWKKSDNIIDNSNSLKFHAIIKYAEQEPETIRAMFKELFAFTDDVYEKQKKIEAFIAQSEELRAKYNLFGYMYENDVRSVLQYLFFRNPNDNYLFKATEAKEFANCLEYYDFWGPMTNFNLRKYYKMCDILVEEIKKYPALLTTDKTRYDIQGVDLYPDVNYHILAFDIIYTSYRYGFYTGMNIKPINTNERKLYEERVLKAKQLRENLELAQKDFDEYLEAKAYVDENFSVGSKLVHKKYGEGELTFKDDEIVTVEFKDITTDLNIYIAYASDVVSSESEDNEGTSFSKSILKRSNSIKSAIERAEKEYLPYKGYLE